MTALASTDVILSVINNKKMDNEERIECERTIKEIKMLLTKINRYSRKHLQLGILKVDFAYFKNYGYVSYKNKKDKDGNYCAYYICLFEEQRNEFIIQIVEQIVYLIASSMELTRRTTITDERSSLYAYWNVSFKRYGLCYDPRKFIFEQSLSMLKHCFSISEFIEKVVYYENCLNTNNIRWEYDFKSGVFKLI